ncbi:MAG: ABC-three component system protein [Bdellovibrionota bacterium]|nr:ABC-three component system protein [Bdellovibrionota bacterium]
MIKKVFSDLGSFKEITFDEGLNIIVAEKTADSGNKQTRNRAGKSSLVSLVHFIFGSSCRPDNLFRKDEIVENHFGLDFYLKDKLVSLSRSGAKPSKLIVHEANSSEWSIQPKVDRKTGQKIISNSNWLDVLSESLFNLDSLNDESGVSFRPLFSYFARRQDDGAFESPFKYFSGQFPASVQSCFFYFLQLDLSLPLGWQKVREREKTIKELKKAAGTGLFKEIIESTSNLRTNIALTESKIEKLKKDISEYKVLPEYSQVEKEASEYIRKISKLANDDTIDLQVLSELEESLEEVPTVDTSLIERVYNEAGVMFPDLANKRLDDVVKFHESVSANRKNYLTSEISSVQERISNRENEKIDLQEKYKERMSLLNTHGALEPYMRLQEKLDKLTVKLSKEKDQFDIALSLETNKTRLESERTELMTQLVNEYKEQSKLVSEAIVQFEEISSELYEEAGSLHIGETLNGPTFDIKIQGEKSKGIGNIQIFCLDLTLMILCLKRGVGPRFLIHDSHIFDGVDERQILKAIILGEKLAREHSFQYIVTLNSDVYEGISRISPKDFKIANFVNSTKLTDESDSGGLFGIRF